MFRKNQITHAHTYPRVSAVAGMLLCLLCSPLTNAQTFPDVLPQHWAFPFIEDFAERGITAGCGGGLYCPEGLVTRAQMAVFMIRAMGRPRVTDGAGTEIGRFMNLTDSYSSIDVFTRTAYMFRIGLQTGEVPLGVPSQNLFFLQSNCTGPAYSQMPPGFVFKLYGTDGNPTMYYTPKATTPTGATYESSTSSAGCQNIPGTIFYASLWETLENDSVVTGVTTDAFVLPLRFDP